MLSLNYTIAMVTTGKGPPSVSYSSPALGDCFLQYPRSILTFHEITAQIIKVRPAFGNEESVRVPFFV
jgi:hypothetical protein